MAYPYTPRITIDASQAQISDPGITFNQTGVSFNDSNYVFGGLYGSSELIPIISLIESISPNISITTSDAGLLNQGFSFNEAGKSFNQAGMDFGGFYGFSDVQPIIADFVRVNPSLFVSPSQAMLSDPGITFNQAGVSFDDSRYTFGGIYGFSNVIDITAIVIQDSLLSQLISHIRLLENQSSRLLENNYLRLLEG